MSNVDQDTEDAVLALFQADDDLVAAAKTLVTDLPETLFSAVDWTELFAEDMLPAVVVLASGESGADNAATYGEIRHEIPLQVIAVVKGTKKATVRNDAQELKGHITRILYSCVTSTGLGITGRGSLVKDISWNVDIQRNESGRRYYGLVNVRATVVVIRERV